MMAAVLQSFPTSSPTLTMLQQARPSSSDTFQTVQQGQSHQRNNQMQYNHSIGVMGAGGYRGSPATSPVVPFGFSNTSTIASGPNPLRQHPINTQSPRLESRTSSAPSVPLSLQPQPQNVTNSTRPRPPVVSSGPAPHGGSSMYQNQQQSSTLPPPSNFRPQSGLDLNPSTFQPASYATVVAKSSPDRYKRNHRRAETSGGLMTSVSTQSGSAMPSGSGMATVGHLYQHPAQSNSSPALTSYPSYRGIQSPSSPITTEVAQSKTTSKDDINLQREREKQSDLAKRYRRRSISSLEAKEFAILNAEPNILQQPAQPKTYAAMLAGPAPQSQQQQLRPTQSKQAVERPSSAHGRNDSSESSVSGRSNSKQPATKSSAKRFDFSSSPSTAQEATPVNKNEAKVINVPARGSSEASKRLTNPSPLSKPMAMSPDMANPKDSFADPDLIKSAAPVMTQAPPNPVGIPESPAAQHLAALNKKEGKKEGKSSRLRRAFSFGSAAELRKASAENSANNNTQERARLRKDRYADEQEAKEAAEIQKQEAAGLGEGIYSGQGNFFTGSTDNLSISSTASSASVMIRKMGKGMKKGSRSLVGLFRPKSVVGVPPADAAVEPSLAQVSMVTVEAEREKVNVNVDPHDQVGGGTGFPKLERNSMDAAAIRPELTTAFDDREPARGRRSIVGGEDERAKVLAAVKKGILKRTGTDSGNSSPVAKPVDTKPPNFNLPQIPRLSESPHSSGPNTPVDEHGPRRGHQRTDSVNIEGEEYFLSTLNFANGDSQSVPGTPKSQAAIAARNISFNPRIQFHDTWPPGEYDRRGEIATCNRLTPMLAQQIKEELNTFKMEMEVHEGSKIYTHFF